MKVVVSFSGGVDSTTCLYSAIEKYGKENVIAVSMIYGQKHVRELQCADKIAKKLDIKRYELNLSNIFSSNKTCSLLSNNNMEIETGDYEDQVKNKQHATIATSVPFRNGLFIASLASYAQGLFPDEHIILYLGNHEEDASTGDRVAIYPDCSVEFTDALNKAVQLGTAGMVELYAPYADKTKADIVKDGLRMNIDYSMTWSCYNGNDVPCGKCGTCKDAIKAFKLNRINYLNLYK